MIVHYAKVAVNAFDEQTGWDRELGLPVEQGALMWVQVQDMR